MTELVIVGDLVVNICTGLIGRAEIVEDMPGVVVVETEQASYIVALEKDHKLLHPWRLIPAVEDEL